MSYLEIVDRVLEKQRKEEATSHKTDVSLLRLSELAKRNIALKIYSEVLGCEIWLCGNEQIANQLKEDDPGAVTYTVDEMRELIRLNPTPDDIKRIHDAKSLFNGSRVLENTSILESLKGED